MEAESDPSLERQFKGHKDGVTAISFHPSGHQFASSSLDHSVMLWNFQSSVRCYRFQGHRDCVLDCAFSPSGKLIASASRDCCVRLWVPSVKGECGEFRAHSKAVRSVHFSPSGTQVITASDDKTLKLWTVHRRKFLQSYVQHRNWVRCVRFSPTGSMLASCSDDKTLKIWDTDGGKCLHTFEETKGYGTNVCWHPTGLYVAVGLSNGTVKLYDIRKNALLQHYRAHDAAISQVTFHPHGNYLLVGSHDKKMKILDLVEGHPVYTLMGHNGAITAVTFTADGEYFASGGADKQIMIWKTNFINNCDDSLQDSKENVSTLETTSLESENSEEKCGDLTKLVDARKSTYFQPDEVYPEEMYANEEPLRIPSFLLSDLEVSSTNSSQCFNNEMSNYGKFRSYLFNQYYHQQNNCVFVPVNSTQKQSYVENTRNDLNDNIPSNENCLCEVPDDRDLSVLPTVKALLCNMATLNNIMNLMDKRISILEDIHLIS